MYIITYGRGICKGVFESKILSLILATSVALLVSPRGVDVALGKKARTMLLLHEEYIDAPETVVPTTADIDLAQPVILPKASVAAIEIDVE